VSGTSVPDGKESGTEVPATFSVGKPREDSRGFREASEISHFLPCNVGAPCLHMKHPQELIPLVMLSLPLVRQWGVLGLR